MTPDFLSGCRWVPWAIAGAFVVVFTVNGAFAYLALSSDTGLVTDHPFAVGSGYNRVLDAVDKQNALGWSLSAASHEGRAVLHLRDRDGRPLAGAAIEAAALRPLGPAHDMALHFHPAADGTYVADAALPLPGQWDLMLRAVQGGQEVRVTRRILVK